MIVENLYIYPVKALRAVEVQSATANANGFEMDRTFMLVKLLPDGGHSNMHTPDYPQLSFWQPRLDYASDGITIEGVTIVHQPPNASQRTISVPAYPDVARLDTIVINMHESSTTAYDMGSEYNDFFTSGLDFPVKLVYLGENLRQVLMSTLTAEKSTNSWTTWASGLVHGQPKERITFTDCAPFMVASRTSLHNVSNRLPDGVDMDMIKFRPNIVVKGAAEAWEEDYWSELRLGDVKLNCVHNCVRCKSITVDYETGRNGTGPTGDVYKRLQSDRRVDQGSKYSPVFGRYAFLPRGSGTVRISVGDTVEIIKLNDELSVMDWPSLSGT